MKICILDAETVTRDDVRLDKITELDEQWVITAGKDAPDDEYAVSIQSNNNSKNF
mgnify:CR=1 FL=1